MKKATTDPSKRLDIYIRISRNGSFTFTFVDSSGSAYNVSDLDFELFIKQNPGSRKDVISLLTSYAGFGLTFPTANQITATFTDSITEVNQGEYYWELLVLDTNKTWLNGKAFFHNGEFDGVDSSESIIIDNDGTPVTITISESSSGSGIGGSTGPTDNAILRANGTGGSTLQSSAVTIDDSGNITLGILGSTVGASRIIQPEGSASDITIILTPKGNGNFSVSGNRVVLLAATDVSLGGDYIAVVNNTSSLPGEIRIYEAADNGSNYNGLKTAAQSASVTYTLPTADGDSTDVMQTDGSGGLYFGSIMGKLAMVNAGFSLTGNTNDLDSIGAGLCLIDSNGAYNLTGITSTLGKVLFLINISAFTITLKDDDANSSLNNRFFFGSDYLLASNQCVQLISYVRGADRYWAKVG